MPSAPSASPVATKRCSRCKEDLPTASFGLNRSQKSGLQTYCKPCHRELDNTRHAKQRTALVPVAPPSFDPATLFAALSSGPAAPDSRLQLVNDLLAAYVTGQAALLNLARELAVKE